MGVRPLTATGVRFMGMLPPVLASSGDYEGCMHALARELERLEGAIEQVRAQFDPATADILLSAWEALTKLPAGGAGSTLAQRQGKVLARLRKPLTDVAGSVWEADVTDILGSGWTYSEHDATKINLVPNPSFERDTTGAAPAAWLGTAGGPITGVSTLTASVAQAQVGTKSMAVATPGGAVTQGARVGIGALPAGAPVTASVWVRAPTAQTITVALQDNAGGAGSASSAVAVLANTWTLITVTWTPTAASATAMLYVYAASGAAAQTFFVDAAVAAPGTTVTYGDGDQTDWGWSGTAGNSTSSKTQPPANTIRVVVPFQSGSDRFQEAIDQLRQITPAHLQLQLVSGAGFQLDVSQQDVTTFGGF